ncbi:response regulator transcription factor [Marinomonas sp. C2222]|uniref:Response regulator transcription factor n=1 Tax=Marinomonas sargassi TaxID=2984494 RepID=A0ABT2YRE5_9GAMM|nr:response regulator transcription factor [Marinomonas sargassi]MCV2402320.1 response regulator transcription factor [Marinomonas sargassi]
MKILCWNTDDAVWKHWSQVSSEESSLVRVNSYPALLETLENSVFQYCFIYLPEKNFSQQVEEVIALRSKYSNLKIIVFPYQLDQSSALRLFAVGVNGQCAPYIGEEQLGLVLSVVNSGEIWGGKAFIQQLISQSSANAVFDEKPEDNQLQDLSERELDVARLIAKGFSNKQIAIDMDITERTVKAHMTSIFKKTHTKDRLSLALLAQSYFPD